MSAFERWEAAESRPDPKPLSPLGSNPVAALMDKPAIVRKEAHWLEVHEAALLLESARTLLAVRTAAGEAIGAGLAHPFVATFLLTGGRYGEILGLELEDVSFDRRTVTFRPNDWRRLKTQTSWRVVPLWPQLEAILRGWVFGPRLERGGRLLFPSFASGEEAPLRETRRLLDRIAKRVGWKAGEIRHRLFRHTLLRRSPADARSRSAGEPLHGEPGARAWQRGHGPPSVRSPGQCAAPIRGGGVPGRAALRAAR